ncbi:MAG: peptide chain release factor N(5)-glutamine methyltransferase [Gaiellaceae bacterium]
MRPLDAVHEIARGLEEAGVPSPRVDAEHLVAHVLELTRTELYSGDGELTEDQVRRLRAVGERRREREPLAYILGEWGFRRLTLLLDGRVLIPRPETEVVVERCLAHLEDVAEPRVLDVGAGSGAIALAIADEHSGARVLAVDRSDGAVAVARENLERTGLGERVEFARGELLRGLSGPFDLVVSNPPYVRPEEYETLQPEIRLYEPYEAVVGVGVAETIAGDARAVLQPGGWLVLECGDGQAESLAAELRALGYADVLVTPDLAGRHRVVEGRRP